MRIQRLTTILSVVFGGAVFIVVMIIAFNRQLAKDVITTFCQRPDKTLIMVTHYEEELPPIITNRLHLLRHE